MEQLVETIDLDIEESNELAFKIKIEGTSASPAKVRLVCEGTDVSYMFSGYSSGTDGVVSFQLPQMKDKLKEGLYAAKVEVLIENRYFAPVQFQLNFKKTLSVVAEAIQFVKRPVQSEISVSASPIQVKQTTNKQVVVETKEQPRKTITQEVTSKTLKERWAAKKPNVEQRVNLTDEEAVRRLARGFIRQSRLSPGIFFTVSTIKICVICSNTTTDKFFASITFFAWCTWNMSSNFFITRNC